MKGNRFCGIRETISFQGGASVLRHLHGVRVRRSLACLALATASVLAGCTTPIRLAFVVNEDHYTISAADLVQTATFADDTLKAATGRGYLYKGAVFGHYGALDPATIFEQYVLTHATDPADYVVIFTKHSEAVQYGGFMLPAFGRSVDGLRTQLASLPGYCNPAGTLYEPPGVIYGAVIDWHHILGGCGYELQELDWVHVSATSFGGQCRNQPGLTCVFQYGEWQCPNLLDDPEWAALIEDRRRFTAQSINHEFLHNFGIRGIGDHQCLPGTPDAVVAQSAFNMCGSTIATLKLSGQRCVLDPRPMGTVCTHKSQCLNSYCYEFGMPIEYQCSHTCATKADCADVPGKEPFCRKRRLDIPSTDYSCYYQPKT
jgi:hypothetical protein